MLSQQTDSSEIVAWNERQDFLITLTFTARKSLQKFFLKNVLGFFPEAGHGSYLLADFCEQLISKAGSVQLLSDNWALFVSFVRAGGA